jgi:phosphotransferase system  glucose/maltose/N-acetylglucosamine-specific IIC component
VEECIFNGGTPDYLITAVKKRGNRVFSRNRKWAVQAFKSLLFTVVFYRFARFFLKMAEKQAGKPEKKKAEKK